MKKIIFISLLAISGFSLFGQISIVRSDFADVNDSIPRIYYSFETDFEGYLADSLIPENLVFTDPIFPVVSIDTLAYFPSSDTDIEGLFTDATCAYFSRDGFVMHLKIADNMTQLIGMQGQLPFSGGIMNLVFTDTLTIAEYPCEYTDNLIDQGAAMDHQPISLFEAIIPADTYAQLSMIFDTVRFYMSTKLNTSFDEYGDIQFIGASNYNGTYEYLRENRKMMTSFDILLRNKFNGSYTSLGDIPGIGDQLPMELPMIDTITTHSYWAKDLKNPLLEIEFNTSYDSVQSMTFRYENNVSIVNPAKVSICKVFPNPTNDFANFYFQNNTDCVLFVYAIDGSLISKTELKSNNTVLDLRSFATGTYVYQIFDKNKVLQATGKLIKD